MLALRWACYSLVIFVSLASGQVTVIPGTDPGSVNIRDYGATGNGTTDDTTAIRNAVTAANGTKPIYFPPGTYLVSGSSSTVPALNITISGTVLIGPSTATFKMAGGIANNISNIMLGSSSASSGQPRVSNVTIEGITIDGNQANRSVGGGTSGHCIWGYEAQHLSLRRVTLQNCSGDGLTMTNGNSTPTQPVDDISVVDSIFLNNNRHDARVDGSHIFIARNYMSGSGAGSNDCVHMEPTASVTLSSDYAGYTVRDNTCLGHGGIELSGKGQNLIRHVLIEGNYIEVNASSTQSAILCDSCYYAKVSLNRINGGPSAAGIPAMGMNKYGTLGTTEGTHLDFYKNIVEGFYSCVKVKDANSDMTIEGNECHAQTNFGIWVESSTGAITSRVHVRNNRVDNTSGTGTGYELRGLQDSLIEGNVALDVGGTNGFKCYQTGSTECVNVMFRNNHAYWATPTSKVGFLITTSSGTPTGINFDNNISNGAARAWDTIQIDSGFAQGDKSGIFVKNASGSTINSGQVACIDTTAKQIVKCAATSGLKTVIGVVASEINNCVNNRNCPVVTRGQETVACTGTVNVGDQVQSSGTTAGSVEAQAIPLVGSVVGKALTTCSSSTLTASIGE